MERILSAAMELLLVLNVQMERFQRLGQHLPKIVITVKLNIKDRI